MTNREKKDYLRQYQATVREVSRLEQEIDRWRSRAEQVTATLSKAPVHGGGARKMEDASIKLAALIDELCEERNVLIELRGNIEADISAVNDVRLRLLLRHRYIDDLTWEQVAVNLGYSTESVSWVQKKHGQALQKLDMERHGQPVI